VNATEIIMAKPEREAAPAPSRAVVITGDVVLDRHVYANGEDRASAEPSVIFRERLGGAALLHELLDHALGSVGKRIAVWTENRAKAEREGKQFDDPKPVVPFALSQPFAESLHGRLPDALKSYGVWQPFAEKKGASRFVWRLERFNGFGAPASLLNGFSYDAFPTDSRRPDLVVLDDGGLVFRHGQSSSSWPELADADDAPLLVLKTRAPLAHGDLWQALPKTRLVVVIQADDLRRHDIQISEHVSWEECVENTLAALERDRGVADLKKAAVTVVNFRSAGALVVDRTNRTPKARLVFDPTSLEGDHARSYPGKVYGSQACLVAGLVHQLVSHQRATGKPLPLALTGLERGMAAGLQAMRRLLELGHGPASSFTEPGLPFAAIGAVIDSDAGGFVTIDVPMAVAATRNDWTIASSADAPAVRPSGTVAESRDALARLAVLTARFGVDALSSIPSYRVGKLFSIDRHEIESLRAIERLIRAYKKKVQPRPLCIGVFGQPGSGKSFGIKAIARGILGPDVPLLEFNLSQFKDPAELVGAFHSVRDAVLRGVTPVAFWDEFDSQNYRWLQYLLAPMQDGAFQQGENTHPIGKCIFVFAGGTSHSRAEFGPQPPGKGQDAPETVREHERLRREFVLLKGPDFVSRLHGHLDVLGVNARHGAGRDDLSWPVRRALVLRSTLGLGDADELDMDSGLLHALLAVPKFEHGARSLEKIALALQQGAHNGHLHRSALLPDGMLALETSADLRQLMESWAPFKSTPAVVEKLAKRAAAIHESFRRTTEESRRKAIESNESGRIAKIDASVAKPYGDLDEDKRQSSIAAALRIPGHLALLGLAVSDGTIEPRNGWRSDVAAAVDQNLELLSQAEHLGWCAERRRRGWRYSEARNNDKRQHPLLTSWSTLPEAEREKDRAAVRSMLDRLEEAELWAYRVERH
jgi:hypothetical protein